MKRSPLTLLTLLAASIAHLHAAEIYVAAGGGGHRMVSPDGLEWFHHTAWGEPKHDTNDLGAIAFFNGAAYVGGGYFHPRLTATCDGQNWSVGALSPGGGPTTGLGVIDETLYAITIRGDLYRSHDGESFEKIADGKASRDEPGAIRRATVGNGRLVGAGDFGMVASYHPASGQYEIQRLAGQEDKNATFKRIAFGNGVFVVGGQDGLLACSSDGVTWENNETTPERGDVRQLFFFDDHFYAVCRGADRKTTVYHSADGKAWEPTDLELAGNPIGVVEDHLYVKVGKIGLQRTTDLEQWETIPNPENHDVRNLARGEMSGEATPPALPEDPKQK